MNTDLVQSLMSVATKPASSNGPAQKRDTTAPRTQEAAAPPAMEQQIVPPTQKVQETVKAVAAQIESYLRSIGRQVELSIDSETGETVISVRDANTGDLIRQIPSAEALRLSQSLGVHQNSLVDILA
jgi:flagellar protein FlaG